MKQQLKESAKVTNPLRRKRVRWGRNWTCVCGSGRKFKKCCLKDMEVLDSEDGNTIMEE